MTFQINDFFKDAEALSHLFNLSFDCAEVPSAWKAAVVSPLFKGGDQAVTGQFLFYPVSQRG